MSPHLPHCLTTEYFLRLFVEVNRTFSLLSNWLALTAVNCSERTTQMSVFHLFQDKRKQSKAPVCSNRALWPSVLSSGPPLRSSWISSLCQTTATAEQRVSHLIILCLLPPPAEQNINVCHPSMSEGCGEGNFVITRFWVNK